MTDKVQKIREEVERRIIEAKNHDTEYWNGHYYALYELLTYIDSMQEEPVSESLEDDNSFEELFQELYVKYNKEISIEKLLDIASNFAKWQRKKDKMVEKMMAKNYATGFEACKRQMMKDAIEVPIEEAVPFGSSKWKLCAKLWLDKGVKGNKVKLIIIKED